MLLSSANLDQTFAKTGAQRELAYESGLPMSCWRMRIVSKAAYTGLGVYSFGSRRVPIRFRRQICYRATLVCHRGGLQVQLERSLLVL